LIKLLPYISFEKILVSNSRNRFIDRYGGEADNVALIRFVCLAAGLFVYCVRLICLLYLFIYYMLPYKHGVSGSLGS